jgi:cobalamin biosynthesis protein CobD/CbiB
VRSINLLKVAAEAELLRMRALLARQGRRAAFGVVAVIFMLGVLVLVEVAGWQVLRLYVASISATLILLGINFVICALFGALAARSSPSHAEREALRVRRQALDAARGALSFTAAIPLISALLGLGRRRGGRGRSLFRLLG